METFVLDIRKHYQTLKPDKKGYYITETYRKVECNRYIPSSHTDVCKCGNERTDHESCDNFEEDSTLIWDYKNDTKQKPTDAYGDIDFKDIAADFLPRYLRCSWDTDCEDLSTLMLNKWQMPKPNLIMVVIGGKMSFSLNHNNNFLEAILNGIVEAAVSTQAWIFTDGMDNGVSQQMGKAVGMRRTFKQLIPTIGVGAWGTVEDNSQLVDPDGSFPASYDKHLYNMTPYLNIRGLNEPEPNHTNFIFLDYGTKKDCHAEEIVTFKIKLEKMISKDTATHLITILIEGGITALIDTARRAEDNIPIVVICGSGRAADLIGRVLQITNDQQDKNHFASPAQRNEVNAMIEEYFGSASDEDFSKDAMKSVEIILKHREYITVWKDEQDGRVDKHILIGLINSLSYQHVKHVSQNGADTVCEEEVATNTLLYNQIQLAITWNRLDLADELIFSQINLQQRQFNELLHYAIKHKQIDFMKSFLERGADIKSFLTEERFDELLSDKNLLPNNKLLHRLLNRHRSKAAEHPMFEHFANVIYDVGQGVYKCPKKLPVPNIRDASKFITKKGKMTELLRCCASDNQKRSQYRFVVGSMNPDEFDMPLENSPSFQDPENLLVLYFVMIHEQEMAKAIWSYSRTPLILALICSNICKWLANQENKRKEVTQDMKDHILLHAEEWEMLAVDIIHEAARRNTQAWVQTLIKHKFYAWGGRSTLDIAVTSKCQKFIAHYAIQQYVTKSWMGKLDADTKYWKLMISIFIGPWWLIRFNKLKEKKKMGKQAKDRKKQAFICEPVGPESVDEIIANTHVIQKLMELVHFYRAPVTKYFIHILIYTIYLLTFVYALVIKADHQTTYEADQGKRKNSTKKVPDVLYVLNHFSTPELIIFAWAFAIVPVEMRQIYHSMPSTIPGKFSKYIENEYNKNDVTSFVLMMGAFIIRVMLLSGPIWTYMFQLLFSVAFIFNVIRVAQFLQIHPKIGPKISMISSMFTDLFFFITIAVLCICAYGVATESLLFPTKQPLTLDTIFGMLFRPYSNLFGELELDSIDDNLQLGYCRYWNDMHNVSMQYDCSGNEYSCDNDIICVYNRIIVKIILGVYMMLAAVLMLNLLIAVFSHTYENLNNQSDKVWKWLRFDLMREFQHRSAIPYPFSIVTYLMRVARWAWRKLCGASSFYDHRERHKRQDEYKRSNIALLENECRRNVMKQQGNTEQLNMKECLDKLNKVQDYVQGFDSQMQVVLDSTVHNVVNEGSRGGTIGLCGRTGYLVCPQTETDAPTIASSSVPILQSPISPLPIKKPYLEVASTQTKKYPGTDIKRMPVKQQHIEWMVPVFSYNPPYYSLVQTSTENIKWNEGDRVSYGGYYFVKSGIPLNPMGRTGLRGKGILERWGPNYASVPIITRFLHSHATTSLEAELEVVCRKNTSGDYELPELKTTIDQPLPKSAKDIFGNIRTKEDLKSIQKTIQKIWKRGILIKRGLMESAYNTDNAWLECIIISYHDDDDKVLKYVTFDDNSNYQWTRVVHGMFSKTHHAKYFERAVYARRVSQYIGEDDMEDICEDDK